MLLKRLGISKNVFVLGWVSFFNDIASEMIYPLIPIFLTTTLGAPVSVVGLIEGIAEAISSILKIISGRVSDRVRLRKPFVTIGYLLSSVSKALLGAATGWPLVLAARFTDRFGKGIRTSARDALIAESSELYSIGRSFGFHRALDTLGAVIGPLIGLAILSAVQGSYSIVFLLSAIPGLVGVALLISYVKETRTIKAASPLPKFQWKTLSPSYKIFLLIIIIFSLGNSSDAFLILRAQQMGMSTTNIVLLYTLFNLVYALGSIPAGILSDRFGSKRILNAGFFLFALVYAAFGLITESALLWLLFPLYGLYMALTEGVSKAFIASLIPREQSGTAFGIFQTAIGLSSLVASVVAGILWTEISVPAPFLLGSATALLAALLFFWLMRARAITVD
ncbi:MAG: MFS transporter [candidate division Zixibacteria bacterium]|nr:MFS transporter [candidate division Zixibacteria bacterium]